MDAWLAAYVSLAAASAAAAAAAAAASRRVMRPKRLVERLRCTRCGYVVYREPSRGDYVGLVLEEPRCPVCGGALVVDAIYEESAEPLSGLLFRRREGSKKT